MIGMGSNTYSTPERGRCAKYAGVASHFTMGIVLSDQGVDRLAFGENSSGFCDIRLERGRNSYTRPYDV